MSTKMVNHEDKVEVQTLSLDVQFYFEYGLHSHGDEKSA